MPDKRDDGSTGPNRREFLQSSGLLGVGVPGIELTGEGTDADENATPDEDPGGRSDPVKPHSGGPIRAATTSSPRALVVKDCQPWYTSANETVLDELGAAYDVVNSDGFADAELSSYDLVVIPSTQPASYYETLESNADALAEYVDAGGTLTAHVSNSGYPCAAFSAYDYLPGGVSKINRDDSQGRIVDESHPSVRDISNGDIDGFAGVMSELTGLPDDANVVVENAATDGPVYAEYSHGRGTVVATGYTIEFPYYGGSSSGYGTRAFLANELSYALSIDPGAGSGVDLGPLVDEKLALAGHIDAISNGGTNDRARVEPTLDAIVSAVEDGSLNGELGEDAIQRLIDGESLVDAALAGAGPGSSEYLDGEYNLSRSTAEYAVNPIVVLLSLVLGLSKVASKIPLIKSRATSIIGKLRSAAASLVEEIFGKGSRVADSLRRNDEAAAEATVDEIEAETEAQGSQLAVDRARELLEEIPVLNVLVTDTSEEIFEDILFEAEYNLNEEDPATVSDQLAYLDDRVDPAGDGPSLGDGGDDPEAIARERLDEMEALLADSSEELEDATTQLFSTVLDWLTILLVLAAIAAAVLSGGTALPFLFGTLATLSEIGNFGLSGVQRANGIRSIKGLRAYSGVGIFEVLEGRKTEFTISPDSG